MNDEAGFSYTAEFNQAIEMRLRQFEAKGVTIYCALLFGSLSNKNPRLEASNHEVLSSDADVLVIVNDNDTYKLGRSDFYYDGDFSTHIPKAEIFVRSVDNIQYRLQALAEICRSASEQNPVSAKESGFLQALTQGTIIRGEIPEELITYIDAAKQAFTSCIFRNYE